MSAASPFVSARSTWVAAVCTAASLASTVSGCPSAHLPDDAGIDPADERVLAQVAMYDAYCRRAVRCAVEGARHEQLWSWYCRPSAEVAEELRVRLERYGGLALNRGRLARCLAFAETACDREGLLSDEYFAACAHVLVESPCGAGACADTQICELTRERCAPPRCVDVPGLGGDCSGIFSCVAPAICDLTTCVECVDDAGCGDGRVCFERACQEPGDLGASCRYGPPCREGLACRDDVCAEPAAAGEACASHNDCLPSCFCSPTSLTCVPGGSAGGACEPSTRYPPGSCRDASLRCEGGTCRTTFEGETCITSGELRCSGVAPYCDYTGTCTADPTGEFCYPECPNGSVCGEGGFCVVTAQRGEPCSERLHCTGSRCVDGTCVPFVHPSEPCGPEALCPPWWSCVAGTCEALPNLGEPCDGPCFLGRCGASGRCEWASVGTPCSIEPGVGSMCEHGCHETLGCRPVQTELGGPCGRSSELAYDCADGMDCVAADLGPPIAYRCVAECAP